MIWENGLDIPCRKAVELCQMHIQTIRFGHVSDSMLKRVASKQQLSFGQVQCEAVKTVVGMMTGSIDGDEFANASCLSRSARAVSSLAIISQSANTSVPAT